MADNHNQKRVVRKFEFRINLNPKTILLWLLVGFVFFSFALSLFRGASSPVKEEIPLSQALIDIKNSRVEKVSIEGDRLVLNYKDGQTTFSRKEVGESITQILKDAGIDPTTTNLQIKDQSLSRIWGDILGAVLPLVLISVFFFLILRQARGAQESIFSFGQSRAKLFAKGKQTVTFNDVAGVDEAKKELEEVVDFLKHPGKYRLLGARTPKGVLLFGPSGVGKTLLARAVAGEASVPFFSMAGSEFMEMLVGVGASRTRDLFLTAKKAAPAIIFIDEIDAIGRQRGTGMLGGHDEREQTLNQILVEMDGFTPNDNVVVLAASVTGDTPVAIKEDGKVRLLPIGNFVDQFYSDGQEGEVGLEGVECLGFERKISTGNLTRNNLYFGHSAFKPVRAVFRHKVKEIYEIEYLGGKVRATGSHSVFVRDRFGIKAKAVNSLKQGDVLVDIPFKANRARRELRQIRAHSFDPSWFKTLPVFDEDLEQEWRGKYLFATQNKEELSQSQIAQAIGVTQTAVSHWQRGVSMPRNISRQYFRHQLPTRAEVTPGLCRLLGYYTAEGYARWEVDFCFSVEESEKIADLIELVEENFNIQPDRIKHITHGAVNVIYQTAPLARFFALHCGKGAANKHVPSFLFEAPYEHFVEFLRGVWLGDGSEDKQGRGEITSVSERLITELNWLCRMHGIKSYMGDFVAKEGRVIADGKPLKAVRAYRLGWGRISNPFNQYAVTKANSARRAIVQKITKMPFDDYVYDLCGVENEAFFGGKSPVLLHNTNRGDLLDPALLRPGRFDRRVILDMPDIVAREAILKIHARGKPFTPDVSWDKVAKRTVGFSGADLENMLNEAAILAARADKKSIGGEEIEEAALKVKLGPAKKRLQTEEDKKLTAYHEAGHAIATFSLPYMDPVSRISIVARGVSLGHTLIPPSVDRTHETKSRLLAQITALLGGRTAEELIFNELTTGAANDIEQATRVARMMVVSFGMSDLGPVNLGPQVEYSETGRPLWMEPSPLSPEMASRVDLEVKKIIDNCSQNAFKILKGTRKKLDTVAGVLVRKETLEQEEFERLMGEDNHQK